VGRHIQFVEELNRTKDNAGEGCEVGRILFVVGLKQKKQGLMLVEMTDSS
jgi:hypothetical protein